jgi:hypothetical protein
MVAATQIINKGDMINATQIDERDKVFIHPS